MTSSGNFSVRKTTDIVRKRFYWFSHTANVTHVAPETDQSLDLLRQVIHWRGFKLMFSDHFQRPTEETSLLLLWRTCMQSGPKRVLYLIKRTRQSGKLSWTTLCAASVTLEECLATRVVISSLGHSGGCAT